MRFFVSSCLILAGLAAPAAAQPASNVHIPAVDFGIGAAFDKAPAFPGSSAKTWRSGIAASACVNVARRRCIGSEFTAVANGSTSILIGPRLDTGFYYGSSRDTVPGRFFASALAGGARRGAGPVHPAVQAGTGADIMLASLPGVSIRWEGSYRHVFRAADLSGGRFMLGILIGPRLREKTN